MRESGKMSELYEKARPLAEKAVGFARDSILVNMRFLDVAMSALVPTPREGLMGVACDGRKLFYDPVFLLKKYTEEPAYVVRMYLHVLFHMIFSHSFRFGQVDRESWGLGADIAAEAAVMELEMPGPALFKDEEARKKLGYLQGEVRALTAEKLYRYLKNGEVSQKERGELCRLFSVDSHSFWEPSQELAVSAEEWKKLSQRIGADLKTFSAGKSKSESMEKSLLEAARDRYPYEELLKKFMVSNEDLQVNDEEFDYIYYTYGLSRYGNMPLVEPLEYKDSKKVKEFVIAIDTSASCRGALVRSFLQKTYALLSGEDNFFRKMNVHIIQCDHQVQKDTKITCREDLDAFLAHEKLVGFGSTDFRPVFAYVDELAGKGEFENLKGMVYFTDGYGVYPRKMPSYGVMFVFPDNGGGEPEVPPWAVRVLLDMEE